MREKNAGSAIRRTLFPLLLLALIAAAFTAYAEGQDALKPYDGETGYTYITFGRYPQSIDGGSPDEGKNTTNWRKLYRDWETKTRKELNLRIHDPIDPYDPGPLEPEPILWRILSADADRIYVMSEYILFASPVHPSMAEYRETGSDFGQTQICAKLNGEFADTAFSEAEKEAMLPVASYGKVSLPSSDDLNDPAKGFSRKEPATRKAMATEYAIRSTGVFVYQVSVGSHSPYWLREQADTDNRQARSTKQTGKVGRLHCDAADVGARPVILLSPDHVRITGGSGTKDDPYTLSAVEN